MSAPNRFYVVDTRYAHMMMDHLNHAQQWIGGLEDHIAVQAYQIDAQAGLIADQQGKIMQLQGHAAIREGKIFELEEKVKSSKEAENLSLRDQLQTKETENSSLHLQLQNNESDRQSLRNQLDVAYSIAKSVLEPSHFARTFWHALVKASRKQTRDSVYTAWEQAMVFDRVYVDKVDMAMKTREGDIALVVAELDDIQLEMFGLEADFICDGAQDIILGKKLKVFSKEEAMDKADKELAPLEAELASLIVEVDALKTEKVEEARQAEEARKIEEALKIEETRKAEEARKAALKEANEAKKAEKKLARELREQEEKRVADEKAKKKADEKEQAALKRAEARKAIELKLRDALASKEADKLTNQLQAQERKRLAKEAEAKKKDPRAARAEQEKAEEFARIKRAMQTACATSTLDNTRDLSYYDVYYDEDGVDIEDEPLFKTAKTDDTGPAAKTGPYSA